jgi:hypothetical protein
MNEYVSNFEAIFGIIFVLYVSARSIIPEIDHIMSTAMMISYAFVQFLPDYSGSYFKIR